MSSRTVLLVESSPKISKQIMDALIRVHFQVTTLEWAEDALSILKAGSYDAILIRTNLSGMDGIQFVTELRKEVAYQNRPVVLLYGKDNPDHKVLAFQAGADDFLVLPFAMPELIARLETRLQRTNSEGGNILLSQRLITERTMDLPSALPTMGPLNSRPLPSLLGAIFLRGESGLLRLIKGKVIRSFYIENGMIRGASSSIHNEKLSVSIEKWGAISSSNRKRLKIRQQSSSDRLVAEAIAKLEGLDSTRLSGLFIRYAQSLVQKSIKMMKGDFDWLLNEKPADMFFPEFLGVSPALLLIHSLRTLFFLPSYDPYLPKPTAWILPSTAYGKLRDSLRLTPQEEAVIALTEDGIMGHDLMTKSRQLLPYSDIFIYILLCFKALQMTDKRESTLDERNAVQLDPLMKDAKEKKDSPNDAIKPTLIDISDSQIPDEMPDLWDSLAPPPSQTQPQPPRPAPKPAPPAPPKSDPAKLPNPHKAENALKSPIELPKRKVVPEPKPAEVISEPETIKPASTSQEPFPQSNEAKERVARKVRELFPVLDDGEKPFEPPEPMGIRAFGVQVLDFQKINLKNTHPAIIFGLIMETKKTGILLAQYQPFESKLFWQRGRLVFARSNKPDLRIDSIMVEMGMITTAQKSQVEQMISDMGKMRSGTIIFKNQIVNMLQLSQAIDQQIKRIVTELFIMSNITYQFKEEELPQDECISFDLPTENLLMSSLRSMKSLNQLETFLPEPSQRICQTKNARDLLNRMGLGASVTLIFDKFRHPATLKDVIGSQDADSWEFLSTILGLMILGLLNKMD